MTGLRLTTILSGLALLLLAMSDSAVSDDELQVVRDSATTRPGREVNDVDHVDLRIARDQLLVAASFRRPLIEGMYQSVEILIDCDASTRTGLEENGTRGGFDLRVRASVGSPFAANSKLSGERGATAPLEQRRCGYGLVKERPAEGGAGPTAEWAWVRPLPAPGAKGRELSFAVPLNLLRRAGWDGQRQLPARILARGICTEHPIPLEHLAADEGVEIETDGHSADWSGGTTKVDEVGDLHPDAADLDVRRVQVDHDREKLYVGVWLAGRGFGTGRGDDEDVLDLDRITVAVEPLGGDYTAYREHVLTTMRPKKDEAPLRAVAREAFAEFAIDRPATQTAYRVVVWSEARRVDRVPDAGEFKLDMRGARRR